MTERPLSAPCQNCGAELHMGERHACPRTSVWPVVAVIVSVLLLVALVALLTLWATTAKALPVLDDTSYTPAPLIHRPGELPAVESPYTPPVVVPVRPRAVGGIAPWVVAVVVLLGVFVGWLWWVRRVARKNANTEEDDV
jgi:hypothetical protein